MNIANTPFLSFPKGSVADLFYYCFFSVIEIYQSYNFSINFPTHLFVYAPPTVHTLQHLQYQ